MSRLNVVAAIIEQNGRILACQRRAGTRHGLKWEFPGGKVEAGETPAEALQRELEEELAIQAVIGREVTRYEFAYPGRTPILLIFFYIERFAPGPSNLQFEQLCWVPRDKLPEFDFLEGDQDLVRRLAAGEL